MAPTPDKETLVTAGGGQGPETAPGRGAVARGIGPFSQHLLLPQEDRSRGEVQGPQITDLQQLSPTTPGLLSLLGPGIYRQGSHSNPHLVSEKEPLIQISETTALGKWCNRGSLLRLWAVTGLEPVSHILLCPGSQTFIYPRRIVGGVNVPHLSPETQPQSAQSPGPWLQTPVRRALRDSGWGRG